MESVINVETNTTINKIAIILIISDISYLQFLVLNNNNHYY